MIHLRVPAGETVEFVSATNLAVDDDPDPGVIRAIILVVFGILHQASWRIYAVAILGCVFVVSSNLWDRVAVLGLLVVVAFPSAALKVALIAIFILPFIVAYGAALSSLSGIPLGAMTFGQAIGGSSAMFMLGIFLSAAAHVLMDNDRVSRRRHSRSDLHVTRATRIASRRARSVGSFKR